MLVLGRRDEQSIVLICGDKLIKVMILGKEGREVRVGIEADKDVEIWREEVYYRIVNGAENKRKSKD